MSATNQTTNYNFPLFVGTDKPAWLIDFNGAMIAIDSSIKTIADLLATVQGSLTDFGTDIGTNASDIETLQGAIDTINSSISTINNAISTIASDVSTNASDIATVQGDVSDLETSKVTKPTIVPTSLPSSAWQGTSAPYTLDLAVTGVTSTSIQQLFARNDVSSAQLEALQKAKIVGGVNSSNVQQFKAYGDKPTIDLPIGLILLGEPLA